MPTSGIENSCSYDLISTSLLLALFLLEAKIFIFKTRPVPLSAISFLSAAADKKGYRFYRGYLRIFSFHKISGKNKKASAAADAFTKLKYNLRLEILRNTYRKCLSERDVEIFYIISVSVISIKI